MANPNEIDGSGIFSRHAYGSLSREFPPFNEKLTLDQVAFEINHGASIEHLFKSCWSCPEYRDLWGLEDMALEGNRAFLTAWEPIVTGLVNQVRNPGDYISCINRFDPHLAVSCISISRRYIPETVESEIVDKLIRRVRAEGSLESVESEVSLDKMAEYFMERPLSEDNDAFWDMVRALSRLGHANTLFDIATKPHPSGFDRFRVVSALEHSSYPAETGRFLTRCLLEGKLYDYYLFCARQVGSLGSCERALDPAFDWSSRPGWRGMRFSDGHYFRFPFEGLLEYPNINHFLDLIPQLLDEESALKIAMVGLANKRSWPWLKSLGDDAKSWTVNTCKNLINRLPNCQLDYLSHFAGGHIPLEKTYPEDRSCFCDIGRTGLPYVEIKQSKIVDRKKFLALILERFPDSIVRQGPNIEFAMELLTTPKPESKPSDASLTIVLQDPDHLSRLKDFIFESVDLGLVQGNGNVMIQRARLILDRNRQPEDDSVISRLLDHFSLRRFQRVVPRKAHSDYSPGELAWCAGQNHHITNLDQAVDRILSPTDEPIIPSLNDPVALVAYFARRSDIPRLINTMTLLEDDEKKLMLANAIALANKKLRTDRFYQGDVEDGPIILPPPRRKKTIFHIPEGGRDGV